jgi:hypothetical protein
MSLRSGEFNYNSLVAKPTGVFFVDAVQRICERCAISFTGARIAKWCPSCAPAARAESAARTTARTTAKRRAARGVQ